MNSKSINNYYIATILEYQSSFNIMFVSDAAIKAILIINRYAIIHSLFCVTGLYGTMEKRVV